MTTSHQEASTEELVLGTPAGESASWNWHPDIPIKTNPLFEFPLDLVATIKWFAAAWLPITEFGVYVLLAFGVWFWLTPPLVEMETLAVGLGWCALGTKPIHDDSICHFATPLALHLEGAR